MALALCIADARAAPLLFSFLSFCLRDPLQSCLSMKRERMPVAAFSIDKHCKCGKVALVYCRKEMGSKEVPEVWFQDLSGKWNFLSSSFMKYFRMMVAHLGLPNWQYRFTEFGMDPISSQWFALIAPKDFVIDLNAPRAKAQGSGSQPSGKEKEGRGGRQAAKVSAAGSGSKRSSQKAGGSEGLKITGRVSRHASLISTGRDRVPSSRRKKQSAAADSRDIVKTSYRIRPKSAFN